MRNSKATAISLVLVCAVTIPAHATNIIVSNTDDSGPSSLRQALAQANDRDTIDATAIPGVIKLTTRPLLLDKTVTINGPGPDLLAIDGDANSRVLPLRST